MFDITGRVVDLLGVGLTSNGQVSLTSDTALTVAGTRKALGAAALTADFSVQATARAGAFATLTAAFDTEMSAAATAVFRSAASALSADSSISADGGIFIGTNAALSAASSLTATGSALVTASAALAGTSTLTAIGDRSTLADAIMASDAALGVTATPARVAAAASTLTGDAAFTSATAVVKSLGFAVMAGAFTTVQATPSPVFRLRMATAKRSITDDWLLKRYPIDAGLSLIVKNGVVTEVEVPSQTELAEADYYFLGGRNNPITPAQRATLIAAGFGSYIEED